MRRLNDSMNYPSKTNEKPDILLCLANLSEDEIFTPPKTANDMLDLLPQNLFRNPFARFLDPACKSGVFLREIVKRLNIGLADKIPDLQERINHIMNHQVFGISVTELTAKITRRTVYCSMNVQLPYCVCNFTRNEKFLPLEGRIHFRESGHVYDKKGKCIYCGAKQKEEETSAYEFIHTKSPEEILGMKFDVVISNPPYQMSDGGGNGASAKPLYQDFITQAKKLQPKYMVMIIPSRWYTGGKGLDAFREEMLNDRHIRVLHDYSEGTDCFTGVQIKGGVCYFLWDRDNEGDCEIINHTGKNTSSMIRPLTEKGAHMLIRYNEAIPILRKVQAFNEKIFADIVSPRLPFGIPNTFKGYKNKTDASDLIIYVSGNDREIRGTTAYCPIKKITRGQNMISWHKVYIAKAGSGSDSFPHPILPKPFYGEPNTVCNESYLVIGPFVDKETCENVMSYIATKFFRFLVLLLKSTQNAPRAVYSLVPMQDFSQSWSDSKLYAKSGLSDSEIAFIDSMIRPMNLKEDSNS